MVSPNSALICACRSHRRPRRTLKPSTDPVVQTSAGM